MASPQHLFVMISLNDQIVGVINSLCHFVGNMPDICHQAEIGILVLNFKAYIVATVMRHMKCRHREIVQNDVLTFLYYTDVCRIYLFPYTIVASYTLMNFFRGIYRHTKTVAETAYRLNMVCMVMSYQTYLTFFTLRP